MLFLFSIVKALLCTYVIGSSQLSGDVDEENILLILQMENPRLGEVVIFNGLLTPCLDGNIWGNMNMGNFRKDVEACSEI